MTPWLKFFQDAFLFLQGERVEELLFHLGREPVDLLLVADVFEFLCRRGGIAVLEMGEDRPKGCGPESDEVTGEKIFVQVFFG